MSAIGTKRTSLACTAHSPPPAKCYAFKLQKTCCQGHIKRRELITLSAVGRLKPTSTHKLILKTRSRSRR